MIEDSYYLHFQVDSFAELFEKACPIADAKRVLRINEKPQDLFLSESNINDLKLDSRAHLLFMPEKLMFEVQNWQFNEPLYCACALYEEGVKITETFYFDISRENKTVSSDWCKFVYTFIARKCPLFNQ
jgi:hypothetical protein